MLGAFMVWLCVVAGHAAKVARSSKIRKSVGWVSTGCFSRNDGEYGGFAGYAAKGDSLVIISFNDQERLSKALHMRGRGKKIIKEWGPVKDISALSRALSFNQNGSKTSTVKPFYNLDYILAEYPGSPILGLAPGGDLKVISKSGHATIVPTAPHAQGPSTALVFDETPKMLPHLFNNWYFPPWKVEKLSLENAKLLDLFSFDVQSAGFSPGGNHIVTLSRFHYKGPQDYDPNGFCYDKITVWSVATRQPIAHRRGWRVKKWEMRYSEVAFSADGKHVVFVDTYNDDGENRVVGWDFDRDRDVDDFRHGGEQDSTQDKVFRASETRVKVLDFLSPQPNQDFGLLVFGDTDGRIFMSDGGDPELLTQMKWLDSVAFAPSGQEVVAAGVGQHGSMMVCFWRPLRRTVQH